jgi:arachidonate 15-lipoxygenase (second type) / 8-lipoxygenase (S-type)
MERLSISPYAVRRLNPSNDSLAFTISDSTCQNLTGSTLQSLFNAGRLFYVDYRNQLGLPSTGRYAPAADAYFYIDSTSGDFLPLAIRTNVGSNLIYTPADDAGDWLLAKMAYNVNDFWFAQLDHLALTHEVVQINYMAAIRTLSDQHPVLALFDRCKLKIKP